MCRGDYFAIIENAIDSRLDRRLIIENVARKSM
jgi:hypothetical protein